MCYEGAVRMRGVIGCGYVVINDGILKRLCGNITYIDIRRGCGVVKTCVLRLRKMMGVWGWRVGMACGEGVW